MDRRSDGAAVPGRRLAVFNIVCVLAIVYSHLRLSYNYNEAWWHSLLGLAVICVIGYRLWGRSFATVAGLQMSWSAVGGVLFATFISIIVSFLAMWSAAKSAGVVISAGSPFAYLHNAVYILNEEIVLGALLIYFLVRKAGLPPLVVSATIAALVAIAHLVLYRWYFRDRDYLEAGTLAALFFAVFVKSNLIIRFRHIGYAWALHFGWMAVMYASEHTLSGRSLTDLEKFNLYLGSPAMVGGTFVLAGISTLLFLRPARTKQPVSRPVENVRQAGELTPADER